MKQLLLIIAFSLGSIAFPSYARYYCVPVKPVKDKCAPKADKCAPKPAKFPNIDLGNCAKCTECPTGYDKVNRFWVR